MASITSQNWDASASLPAGWSATTGLAVVTGINFVSGSRSLSTNSSQGSGTFFATYTTADSNGGDCVATSALFLNATSQSWGLFGRSSANPPNLTSAFFYDLRVEYDSGSSSWKLSLYKTSSGTPTLITSVTIGTFSVLAWYTLTFDLSGTTLVGKLQRQSDGYWLTSGGSWQSSAASAIATTDSGSTSSGYWGLVLRSTTSAWTFADDYTLDTSATSPNVTISATAVSGAGTLPSVSLVLDQILSASPETATGTLPDPALSLGFTASGAIPFSALGVLTEPSHSGPDDLSVAATYLAGAGELSDASYVEAFAAIATTSLVGAGSLVDPAADGQPLAALGVLPEVGLNIPPTIIVAGPALVAAGQLASVAVGTGLSFAVSSLSGSGTISAVATITAAGLSVSVNPLSASGTLSPVHTWLNWTSPLVYSIYANDGAGGLIDYSTPIGATQGLTFSPPALAYAGDHEFGVRVSSLLTGLEERNLDAMVRILLDSTGADITNRPVAPVALRAFARANGAIRVEWAYPLVTDPAKRPTGFKVYLGSPSVSYASAVATVTYSGGVIHSADIAGLADGTTYAVGVRAYNGSAEEPNTSSVSVTADATGPTAVVGLTATGRSSA